jgi:hypothetical protein
MWHVVGISLHIASLILGLIACYLAVFIYEKGHARLRNKLEDWWKDFEGAPAFMRHLAFSASSCFLYDDLFFLPLTVPLMLSLEGSVLICLALRMPAWTGTPWGDPVIVFRIAENDRLWHSQYILYPWLAIVFMVLLKKLLVSGTSTVTSVFRKTKDNLRTGNLRANFSRAFRRSHAAFPELSFRIGLKGLVSAAVKLARIPIYLLLCLLAPVVFVLYVLAVPLLVAGVIGFVVEGGYVFGMLEGTSHKLFGISRVLVVLVGQTTAVLFFQGMKWIFEHCWYDRWALRKSLLVMLAMCALASLLFWGPLWFVDDGWTLRPPAHAQLASANTRSAIARYLSYSNAVDAIQVYVFVAAAVLLLAHRWAWPHLRRAMIALRLAGVSLSRKRLFCVGIVLLLLATGWFPGLLREAWQRPEIIEHLEKLLR